MAIEILTYLLERFPECHVYFLNICYPTRKKYVIKAIFLKPSIKYSTTQRSTQD